MAIEILTPQLGKVKKSAKDLVISALLYEHPLNLARLTNTINKKFHASVTFQGVRKAVNQLAENKVIVREGKEYSLSKEWILELREFAEKLQESYFTERSEIKDIQAIGEDIKVYTFDNLIDLDKFWNRIIEKWFDKRKDKSSYVQLSGHTWYVLGQLEEETATLEKIRRYKIPFYTLANDNTFLDRWCKRYYEDQGFFYSTNKEKKRGSNGRYFAVYDEHIIQTTYPEDIRREIDEIYNSTKDFESFEVAKLIKILRKKTELKVTVMKNAVIAEQLREHIMAQFKS